MIFTSTLRLYSEAQNGLILPPSKQRNSPVSLFTSEDVSHRPRAKRLPAESLFFFFFFFFYYREIKTNAGGVYGNLVLCHGHLLFVSPADLHA